MGKNDAWGCCAYGSNPEGRVTGVAGVTWVSQVRHSAPCWPLGPVPKAAQTRAFEGGASLLSSACCTSDYTRLAQLLWEDA